MTDLDKLFAFNNLLHEFRKIERRVFVNGTDRPENDAEHSYMLAMLAWYVISTHKLKLDLMKVCMYALAHDLVEIYAGDESAYMKGGQQAKDEKAAKEYAAALRLKEEFPEFEDLHKAIEDYEKREDEESKFVYALDKVQPIMNIYFDNGRTWRKEGVTFEMIKSVKGEKVKIDPTAEKYFKELMEILEKDEERLFQG